MLERIKSGLRGAAAYAEGALNERVIRVAVTGLSRSGKTVFITSLIHNLLALGKGRNTLPKLQELLESNEGSRLRNIRIHPAGTSTTPYFDFDNKLTELASNTPSWPPRTEDLSEIALSLEIERQGALSQRLGARRIRLELLDYPGEWLLDLPLLSKTYAQWSRETMLRLRRPSAGVICVPFLNFLKSVSATQSADDTLIRRGHAIYRQVLQECRSRLGLRYLQPGRFLCPGPRADAPFLWFFPIEDAQDHPAVGSMCALMRDRFEAYKADMRTNFFDTHFTMFERQIFLVDILSALHAGQEAFQDTAEAISGIVRSLSYGSNLMSRPLQDISSAAIRFGGRLLIRELYGAPRYAGELASLATSRRIERLAIVATKADHVPTLRRENLKNLVRALAERALSEKGLDGRSVTYHTAASVNSTKDGVKEIDGQLYEVVFGSPLGDEKPKVFYPGDVPSGFPPQSFWSGRYFELPIFAPPALDPSGAKGIPHLGLDEILAALLQDAF